MWNEVAGGSSPQTAPRPQAYTLKQFADALTAVVNSSPSVQNVWVVAELSDLRVVGGHCYTELVEKDASGQDVAKIRATCWASVFFPVNAKFRQATGRELASGLKVMLRGSASHHPKFGLTFNIHDVDPSYTLGDIERVRREILYRLYNEGVLNVNKSLPVPVLVQRVAVISAAGAAGYGDFTNQLDANRYGFVFYPRLFPAVMQGVKTAPSVLAALDRVERTRHLWDCVVIVRGGGSTTDMTGFDNYELARRVATFPIPVVVGIGHERDRNVLDEIACVRCKTPTAVGAWLVEHMAETFGKTQLLVKDIMDYASARINGENQRLAQMTASVPVMVRNTLSIASERLRSAISSLPLLAGGATAAARSDLMRKADAVGSAALAVTATMNNRLEAISDQLRILPLSILKTQQERLASIEYLLKVLDPAATLKRGYSITRVNGKAVTDASTVPSGTPLEIRLYSGTLHSTTC